MAKGGCTSYARISPYLRGAIYALYVAGWSYRDILNEIEKPDESHPCIGTIGCVVKKAEAAGSFLWDGCDDKTSTGRPRSTSTALDKAIVKLVFKHRGSAKVTVAFIRKTLRAARGLATRTIARRLCDAGLAWLRRRRKSLVPSQYKVARLDWAAWVLARHAITLSRWAYTDGATFFLARTAASQEDKCRGSLGPMVWRQANGSDGLYEDCVGPSAYWKAQGTCVKIWGLLVAGMLFIYVLPEGRSMNQWWYE